MPMMIAQQPVAIMLLDCTGILVYDIRPLASIEMVGFTAHPLPNLLGRGDWVREALTGNKQVS
jgi:hypothetical protein